MKCPDCESDIESTLNQCQLCDCKIYKDSNIQHYTAKNDNKNALLSKKGLLIFTSPWRLCLLFLG